MLGFRKYSGIVRIVIGAILILALLTLEAWVYSNDPPSFADSCIDGDENPACESPNPQVHEHAVATSQTPR